MRESVPYTSKYGMWVVRVTSGGCFGRKNKDPSQVEREMAADLELERERDESCSAAVWG